MSEILALRSDAFASCCFEDKIQLEARLIFPFTPSIRHDIINLYHVIKSLSHRLNHSLKHNS